MKVLMVAVLLTVIVLSIGLSGCSTKVKAFTEPGQVVNTSVNGEFTIALGSNITTGYSWQPVFDSAAMSLVKEEYKADDTTGKQLVGSGGTEYFTFKMLKAGETKVTLTYYRPWETPAASDKTETFTIVAK